MSKADRRLGGMWKGERRGEGLVVKGTWGKGMGGVKGKGEVYGGNISGFPSSPLKPGLNINILNISNIVCLFSFKNENFV